MRIKLLTGLLFIGICLGNGDVSPKCVEIAKALIEYVNTKNDK